MEKWTAFITACAPIIIAIVTIIPTIISNRRKTESSLQAMEAKITTDINSVKDEVSTVKQGFVDHVDEYEEAKAKAARYRILRFYDELCEGKRHSESHFEDVLDDIDFYEKFCDTHKYFHNNRGHAAMEHVKETYRKVKTKGGFLTHKEDE
jgi:hypothetical protein